MATCEISGIDSNTTGTAIAEEVCLQQLPVQGPAVAASTTLTFLAQPVAGDTITLGANSFQFVDTAPSAGEVEIAATVAETATALATAIDALPDFTAVANGAEVTVTLVQAGADGNQVTINDQTSSIQTTGLTFTGGLDESEGPLWMEREVNEYQDFGGETSTVARAPINPSRQNKKGTIVSIEAAGGWNEDKTFSNFAQLLQGFFFADAYELPTTRSINKPGTLGFTPITAVTANSFQAANGLGKFAPSDLILASGFPQPAQNGLHLVSAATAQQVTVGSVLPAQAADIPAGAKLEKCGAQFASGDIGLQVTNGVAILTTIAADWTAIPQLVPGSWIYLGGDAAVSALDGNRGFARIGAVTQKSLTLDQVTWNPTATNGAGKSVRIFMGLHIRNEPQREDIVRRTYTIRRTLGEGEYGQQAEYLTGSVCNELTLNVPDADKLNVDLTFESCDHIVRSGAPGDELLPGATIPAPGEDPFNTSQDLVHNKIYIHSNGSNAKPLFGYVAESTLAINNGASPDRALGHIGAIDVSVGNFEVSGTMTAYFNGVDAIRAVRSNADVGWFMAFALKNQGFLFDVPLLGLSGGRAEVEAGQKIMMPIEPTAGQSKFGTTASYTRFAYLPQAAMPSV